MTLDWTRWPVPKHLDDNLLAGLVLPEGREEILHRRDRFAPEADDQVSLLETSAFCLMQVPDHRPSQTR